MKKKMQELLPVVCCKRKLISLNYYTAIFRCEAIAVPIPVAGICSGLTLSLIFKEISPSHRRHRKHLNQKRNQFCPRCLKTNFLCRMKPFESNSIQFNWIEVLHKIEIWFWNACNPFPHTLTSNSSFFINFANTFQSVQFNSIEMIAIRVV